AEIDPRGTIQSSPIVYSLVPIPEQEEKVYYELKTCRQLYQSAETNNMTTYSISAGFRQPQSSQQSILDFDFSISGNDSTNGRHQLSLVASQLDPSLHLNKIHPKSNKNLSLNSNQDDDNLCVVCNDKASGNHYGVLSCEGWLFPKKHLQESELYMSQSKQLYSEFEQSKQMSVLSI
ncbi:unnamed protein product, partial [Acanthocheilonema viteae]